MTQDRRTHWEKVYEEKAEAELSWTQADPGISLELSETAGITGASSVIDVGAGTSRFGARLIQRGIHDVTVLDISEFAIERARRESGEAGEAITWIVADITTWTPSRTFDLWHDRAVFHFLVDQGDRAAYIARLHRALRPGGHAIIATFALDGPDKCSGLPVVRYSPQTLGETLGEEFKLIQSRLDVHRTPWDSPQPFQFSLFERRN
ncbi:class I SAM-dependent methyltransferase [Roseibium sp. Sym1]|uniref:class I SAM-dependent methyltransferase n=1 Tax=Roseibium sp. Sym1 TaxID=3016006 RepID=UPI0022B5290C|nr:class I SAM-dependent methyltransferase [Roseibium sp. Sym1]